MLARDLAEEAAPQDILVNATGHSGTMRCAMADSQKATDLCATYQRPDRTSK